MNVLCSLGVYLTVVFLGGAVLAPWLYWGTQSLGGVAPHLASAPFHRFLSRSIEGLALIGLWPWFRSLGATSWRELGLHRSPGQWRQLAGGFALGFASLALVAILALAAGARALTPMSEARLAEKLLSAAMTAVAVAVIEEILFRGALFGALRRAVAWPYALLMSSLVYAALHYLHSARASGSVAWNSGLKLLPRLFQGLTQFQEVIPGFLTLTLAGVLLGLVYQRSGSLHGSIGLHAGWVFWLKSYGAVSRPVMGSDTWFWGTNALINGWLALLVLGSILLLSIAVRPGPRPTLVLPGRVRKAET